MAGMALPGEPHAHHLSFPASQQIQHLRLAAVKPPLLAPTEPHARRRASQRARLVLQPPQGCRQPGIRLLPHRLLGPAELGWIASLPGEQVEDEQTPMPPLARQTPQPTQGGIVTPTIGCGGIEPEEKNGTALLAPGTQQPPAILATGTEQGCIPVAMPCPWHGKGVWQAEAIRGG